MDILALLQCCLPYLTATTLRQFSRIAFALLVMRRRVTMLGISRWAGQGGSYRTVQRFFHTGMPWASLFWVFLRQHLYHPADVYLLAGDEVVVTKAGKHTYGLDRFFSSLYGKLVPGLSFFTLSLVSVQERRSFPLRMEQVVHPVAEKTPCQATSVTRKPETPTAQRSPGRPKGRKNKNKADVTLTPELLRIKAMIAAFQQLIVGMIPVAYLVLDGHFGNHNAMQMARQNTLHLISKLRCDAAVYLPYTGPYAGPGPRRKYGRRLEYRNIPKKFRKKRRLRGISRPAFIKSPCFARSSLNR